MSGWHNSRGAKLRGETTFVGVKVTKTAVGHWRLLLAATATYAYINSLDMFYSDLSALSHSGHKGTLCWSRTGCLASGPCSQWIARPRNRGREASPPQAPPPTSCVVQSAGRGARCATKPTSMKGRYAKSSIPFVVPPRLHTSSASSSSGTNHPGCSPKAKW